MSRARVAQKAPHTNVDLTGFPIATPIGAIVRAHSRDFDPWFFANQREGRFDLTGDRGTCYAAESVRTAVRERLGESCVESKVVSFDDADAMAISLLAVPDSFRAAAISAPGADDFPVTSELSTMSDYTVTQAWAARFDEDPNGFDGVHYRSRFSISDSAECWAIFGAAGADERRPVAQHRLLDGHSACAEAGLTVTPPPPTSPYALSVVLPPGVRVVRADSAGKQTEAEP